MRGIGVTLFINWAVKPFSMALLGWIFVRHRFASWLPQDQVDSYIAGLILLAAAPCTAMVFVWSNLCDGEPHFTLSQVALNDTIMLFAFAPLVGLLLGLSSIAVPWGHFSALSRALHSCTRTYQPIVAESIIAPRRSRSSSHGSEAITPHFVIGAASHSCLIVCLSG